MWFCRNLITVFMRGMFADVVAQRACFARAQRDVREKSASVPEQILLQIPDDVSTILLQIPDDLSERLL